MSGLSARILPASAISPSQVVGMLRGSPPARRTRSVLKYMMGEDALNARPYCLPSTCDRLIMRSAKLLLTKLGASLLISGARSTIWPRRSSVRAISPSRW